MEVRPDYKSIGDLFRDANVFNIPPYQRGYAWEKRNVDDFIEDLEVLISDPSAEHFFGCLVCAQEQKIGGHQQVNSLVDGQQRLTTFVILARCIKDRYAQLLRSDSGQYQDFIKEKINQLDERYFYYKKTENKKTIKISRLELSRKDAVYFSRLLNGELELEEPVLESQKRIRNTYRTLNRFVKKHTSGDELGKCLDELERIETILNERCNIIHLVTLKVADAYKLFQSINDRGKALNQTDLIRADTLGLLDKPGQEYFFNKTEEIWDELDLLYGVNLEKLMGIYLTAVTGVKVKSTGFYDQCMELVFNNADMAPDEILKKLLEIKGYLSKAKRILDGDWPFDDPSLNAWHKSRSDLLVNSLQHSHPLPLLLSATILTEKEYSAIVRTLEVFFFRYKYICKNKIDPATKIYHSACKSIQNGSFVLQNFRSELRELINEYASSTSFRTAIESLRYPKDSKGIKYLLLGLEENWRWVKDNYKGGLSKKDQYLDTSKVYDFKSMTIEHVYPQKPKIKDLSLEEYKNSIGNLTLLDPELNSSLGNIPYNEKHEHFINTSRVMLNTEFSEYPVWDADALQSREKMLLETSDNVFMI